MLKFAVNAESLQHGSVILGPQIRAARALLGWSAQDLANNADVSYATVQRAESQEGIPNIQARNLSAIQNSLERAGVVFLPGGLNLDGGPGVRLNR